MTDTPLIDQLTALGPAGRDLLNASRDFVHQAESELRALERQARRDLLDERVGLFFAANPGASANECARNLPGFSRPDVLEAVRQVLPTLTSHTEAA